MFYLREEGQNLEVQELGSASFGESWSKLLGRGRDCSYGSNVNWALEFTKKSGVID